MCVPCGHQIEPVAGKPNNLRLDARSVAGDDVASVANRGVTSDRFERKSDHSSEGALDWRGRSAFHAPDAAFESAAPERPARDLEVGGRHGVPPEDAALPALSLV